MSTIARAQNLNGLGKISAVSVVFAANARPTAEAVRALSRESGQFAVSYDPSTDSPEGSGWVELLANGLTFDCSGLAPGPGDAMPERAHNFGLAPDLDLSAAETITLVPGPHLSSAYTMFPVIRSLAWLGALLSDLPGAQAVCWHSARSFNAPAHFRTSVIRWIEGGAFPGFGLTALVAAPDGGLASEGLALFIGQEIHLAPELVADRAAGAKLALRLIHWLIENGRIELPVQLAGPTGEPLLLSPLAGQQIIKVYKSS